MRLSLLAAAPAAATTPAAPVAAAVGASTSFRQLAAVCDTAERDSWSANNQNLPPRSSIGRGNLSLRKTYEIPFWGAFGPFEVFITQGFLFCDENEDGI